MTITALAVTLLVAPVGMRWARASFFVPKPYLAGYTNPVIEAPPVPPAQQVDVWAQQTAYMRAYLTAAHRPTTWATVIVDAARTNRLSPWLIAAIIDVETGGTWNPDERGDAGDIGLMQVMPGTVRDMAITLGQDAVDPWDPIDNIRLGAAYMGAMAHSYPDAYEAVAAYNGGPGGRHLSDCRTYAKVVLDRKMTLEAKWSR